MFSLCRMFADQDHIINGKMAVNNKACFIRKCAIYKSCATYKIEARGIKWLVIDLKFE